MAGRKPKLNVAKLGNRTKEELEEAEMRENGLKKFEKIDADYVPTDLSDNAKKEWQRIIPLLQELPIASLDLALVSAYCQTYSDYIQAAERMKQEGAVVVTERGTKLNQNHAIKRDALAQLNSISSKLGLTVESRLKILDPKNETPKKQSVYDQFGISDND
ncbi:phage terminase small subunit P27 family [Staphylococcus condimenti]|uniref:phage terminase small subunit P27 family n=1 Tax=Staphylococcus condimenti TaxID=70255 RepID=UPI00254D5C54|nr:phage terminase small subunit P27 family [Staphylococcus condimenti]MDK8645518.1 phage terminase small subunit P27 family [Staphylococcus condimenti]